MNLSEQRIFMWEWNLHVGIADTNITYRQKLPLLSENRTINIQELIKKIAEKTPLRVRHFHFARHSYL